MLKHLRIFNIILVEAAEVTFHTGLNAITGETGSGKSAIIHALNFISGVRAESSAIRKGADRGSIEALFDISSVPRLLPLLEEAGIDHDCEAELIIRRDIFANGKSRAYINNQAVQLAFLKSVGEHLINIVGQHANRSLLSTDSHRAIIDLYGGLEEEVADFKASWREENRLREHLEEMIQSEAQSLREREMYVRELEELDDAALKEGEDEALFSEYTLLANSEELMQRAVTLSQALSGEKSLVSALNRHKHLFEGLVALDGSLDEALTSFNSALLELHEVAYALNSYRGRIECNPARTADLNQRLQLINTLKRKYGRTIGEILAYRENVCSKLEKIANRDADIEGLQVQLQQLSEKNDTWSLKLTAQRTAVAEAFSSAITKQIASLNMAKAEFFVEVSSQKRSSYGNDTVEFFLQPNVGESKIPLKDCASGGELSRLLLALHAEMAGKDQIATLIFDEIDANIGGETASIVGSKLRDISKNHQLLCITHFHQVAKQAHHHLQISKAENDGRTSSKIETLNSKTRQRELTRMLGG